MTRVLLWDEDSFVLACMREGLAAQPDIEVVGEARTIDEMRQLVELRQPDVLIMDALMPDANVFDVIREIKAMPNPPNILISSMFGQAQVVRRMLDNAEIADRLSLTVRTVKNHITNIYGKLGVGNERAAIAFAWRIGFMDHLRIEK